MQSCVFVRIRIAPSVLKPQFGSQPKIACVHNCISRHKVQLVQLSQRPTFADYMRYLGDRLLGRTVVLVNMDVFIAEGWLGTKSPLLPPNTAFFLSRYHRRVDYGVGESTNALRIVLNASARAAPASLGGAMHASIRTDVKTRSCDLRAAAHAAWHRCSCVPENFGDTPLPCPTLLLS